ncbi:uncharacterized protein [Cherax quadricarinatus]|uniref:uncharacterized protein n=1 Tax=Cherax quadricarinatus TaxID=27406 RepID=UPI00387EE5D8
MRVVLLCVTVTLAAAQSQEDLQLISSHSHSELEAIMNNSTWVKAMVDCVVEAGDCSDPFAKAIRSSVNSSVNSLKICSICKARDRINLHFIMTQLILNNMDEYRRISRHYNLTT